MNNQSIQRKQTWCVYLLLPNLFVYIYLFLFNFIELIIQIFFFFTSTIIIYIAHEQLFYASQLLHCLLQYHVISFTIVFFFFKLNTCHTFFISRVIGIHFSYNYSFLCPMICFLYLFCFFFLFKSTHLSI